MIHDPRMLATRHRATSRGRRAPDHERRAVDRASGIADAGQRISARESWLGSLLISGQKSRKIAKNPPKSRRGPAPLETGASAMFFTNNTVKNDMVVSRETLLIF